MNWILILTLIVLSYVNMLCSIDKCSLAAYMTEDEVHKGVIFPPISKIRDITKEVAAAVIKEAVEEDLAEGYRDIDSRELQKICQSREELLEYVQNSMWSPEYPTLVYKMD